MTDLSQRDIDRIAEAVARHAPHTCSVFTQDEIAMFKMFIKRLDAAGKTAWVVFIGAIVSFVLGALGWGIVAKIKGIQ